MRDGIAEKIFNIDSSEEFRNLALEIFEYQSVKNPVYRDFINQPGIRKKKVETIYDIPFLPVEFFKYHRVATTDKPVQSVFESSGTSGTTVSRHYISDPGIYQKSFKTGFKNIYGDPSGYMIAALLPSYTERKNSSLVYMMNGLIGSSTNKASGFYKNNIGELLLNIEENKGKSKVLLIGVSFALLDLADDHSPDLTGVIVVETGGMKGRREEITRKELHCILKEKMNLNVIHSEYGMTELLSQAYSSEGDGIFHAPPWMKVMIRDPYDPLSLFPGYGKTGGINIIDLANIYSCPFIATSDLGKLHENGGFEVLGRFDSSDIRGCNLMSE
jgi:phenylacetate-coenzyme A ligase PaaK-like adenylate-forming protein